MIFGSLLESASTVFRATGVMGTSNEVSTSSFSGDFAINKTLVLAILLVSVVDTVSSVESFPLCECGD